MHSARFWRLKIAAREATYLKMPTRRPPVLAIRDILNPTATTVAKDMLLANYSEKWYLPWAAQGLGLASRQYKRPAENGKTRRRFWF